MHRPQLLVLTCALAACSGEPAPDTTAASVRGDSPRTEGQATSGSRGATRLTIYSGDYEALAETASPSPSMPGYALVERPLEYQLQAGPNEISATGMPASTDVEAAILRSKAPGVTIESQRHVAALTGTGDLVSRLLGHRITVEHTSGNAKQTDSGVLVDASDGLTLALNDGRIKTIRGYDSFSVVDGARLLPQQARIEWTVNAASPGDARFTLAYPMGGLAWRAEYLATIDDAGAEAGQGNDCQLALEGAALIANRAGVSFSDAQLTLVAGEPRRVARGSGGSPEAMYQDMARAAPAAKMPVERESAEYHAYEVPGTIRIGSGSTERVPLFPAAASVACERGYVVDAGDAQWQPPFPLLEPGQHGRTGALPVTVAVTVANTEAAGLGRPLPAGRVRLQDGDDFLGESTLQHTATGSEVHLEVGTAFDLGAERESTDFRLDANGRSLTESFRITLRNARQQDVQVEVLEPLPRWSEWEIISSSVEPEKKEDRRVGFDVTVPAGGESELEYTVRYRWPQGAMR